MMWLLLWGCDSSPSVPAELAEQHAALEAWKDAEQHRKAGDYLSALEDVERALEKDTRSPELWLSKGHVLAGLQRFDEAIAAASRALEFREGWSDAYYDRACWYSRAGEVERAAADLAIALSEGGIDRLTAAADPDLEALRADERFSSIIPDRYLPADVQADERSFFLGSDWEVHFKFLNRPDAAVELRLLDLGDWPARHVRTVEDIWPEGAVNSHDLRIVFRVTGSGAGSLGPWHIEASGLSRELASVKYAFRQPPLQDVAVLKPMKKTHFLVPSTHFMGVSFHEPVRRGGSVLIKTYPGERVEWAADRSVGHELREKGQTKWLGWSAKLPPESFVEIRRGSQSIWSGKI